MKDRTPHQQTVPLMNRKSKLLISRQQTENRKDHLYKALMYGSKIWMIAAPRQKEKSTSPTKQKKMNNEEDYTDTEEMK